MQKLLNKSVLALALVLASSTCAHAESVALSHGGFDGFIQEILDWLFGHSSSHTGNPPNTNPPTNNPGGNNPGNNVAPEVDPSLAMSGFMLLGGTLTVLRSRRLARPDENWMDFFGRAAHAARRSFLRLLLACAIAPLPKYFHFSLLLLWVVCIQPSRYLSENDPAR